MSFRIGTLHAEDLAQAIDALPLRQAQVFVLRYLVEGGKGLLQTEVAEVLGVCKQRVAQLEAVALRRLRATLTAMKEAA